MAYGVLFAVLAVLLAAGGHPVPSPVEVVLPAYPAYPYGIAGRAVFAVTVEISAAGAVEKASVTTEYIDFARYTSRFTAPLLEAVRRWKYAPGRPGRRAVLRFHYERFPCTTDCPTPFVSILDPPSDVYVRGYTLRRGGIGMGGTEAASDSKQRRRK